MQVDAQVLEVLRIIYTFAVLGKACADLTTLIDFNKLWRLKGRRCVLDIILCANVVSFCTAC